MITVIIISTGRTLQLCLNSFADKVMCSSEVKLQVTEDTKPGKRLGFAGAIIEAWKDIDTEYIFHLEEDFIFNERINLDILVKILENDKELAQIALKRQAWGEEKLGFMEDHPAKYTEVQTPYGLITEHREFFTTNPSLYRRSLTFLGWDNVKHSERSFSDKVFRNGFKCAYLGGIYSKPKVTHIAERTKESFGY